MTRASSMLPVATLLLASDLFAAAPAEATPAELDPVVVTGTRASDRKALESISPIQVISAERLRASGYSDLARALEFAEPSLNFPRAATTPSSANTRPITLRGLSPDETLVLVNGKRWHATAVINVNFAVGRGSAPFDLSTLPLSAVDHVEVLRGGAAAQYGSDAIAGVVNIILRSNDSGGGAQFQTGITDEHDGVNADAAVNRGFAFGDGGRLTLSGELGYADATNRAAIDQRYNRLTYRIGDPEANNANGVVSLAYPLAAGELYDDALVARKDSSSAVNFRTPGSSPIYPNGTLPLINPVIVDAGNTLGLRGKFGNGFDYDLSTTLGYSRADFTVRHSANASLGLDSPTTFDAGSAIYTSDVTDFTLNRALPDWWAGGNFAAGAEYRYESYRIRNGEPDSTVGAGSLGFPGFNPRIPVDDSRHADAAFVDLEIKPLHWLTAGLAGRYDHYSDFGSAPTWKASLRAQATDSLALRGSLGTGFRAPSLQQQYYSSISTLLNGGATKTLVNLGTFQVNDPIAKALGAQPLRAEKSREADVGLVFAPTPEFSLSIDAFRTDIDNRIALSDALQGTQVQAVLAAAGITDVQQVAFFTNALDTRTQGFDVSARYAGTIDDATDYTATLGYEHAPTTVRSLLPNPVLPSLPLITTHALLLLTQAQPANKLSSQFTVYHGPFSATLSATRFGEYTDAPVSTAQTFGAKTIVDLSLSFRLNEHASLAAGMLNIGDVYPDVLQPRSALVTSTGGSFLYGEETPWGVDGRTYFARVSVDF